jgi:3-methyl-2-oxobutanoate hydroxymethyltransferase
MNAPAADFRAAKARGEKLAVLTAYDYPLARLLDEAGIDIILVGDSLGMVVLGFPDTTHVTMEHMLHHTAAAARGVKRALLVADLPAMAYETPADAVKNARRLVGSGARAVKLEGGVGKQAEIAAIVADGIPVVGHIGMLPQSVLVEGGYKIKGRTPDQAAALLADALAVEAAGALAVVLELVTPPLAAEISRAISIPTIGIGSGEDCDGQVLVTHDLVGMFPWFKPRFVRQRAQVAGEIDRAVREFIAATREGK